MKLDVKIIGGKAIMDLLREKKLIIDRNLEKDILACAIKVEASAKKKCPHKTNRLRSSITHEVKGMVGKVGTNVKYAPHVEYGTSAHIIEVKNKKVLTDGKGNFFGKRVHHPGTQPQPFLYPALRDNANYIKKKLSNSVVNSLGGK